MKLTLKVRNGRHAGRVFDRTTAGVLVVGRHGACDVQLDDETLSRRHCEVWLEKDGVRFKDLGSSNGVKLNGRLLAEGFVLDGDVLTVGELEFEVSIARSEGAGSEPTCELCTSPIPPGERAGAARLGIVFRCGRCLAKERSLPGYVFERRLRGWTWQGTYLARSSATGEPVAVDWQRADGFEAERFADDARRISTLLHPNLVRLIDWVHHDGGVYVIRDHFDGETLRERVERTGPLPSWLALSVAAQIASALDDCRQWRLVHGAVTPDAILLTVGNHAMLSGIEPRGVTRDPGLHSLDGPRGIECLAPELIEDARRVEHRTDLYALGATIFYALAGRHAFAPRKTTLELLRAITSEAAPPISSLRSDVPQGAERLVARCLSKRPEDRPLAACDIVTEVQGLYRKGT